MNEKNRKLILFTESYPYGNTEQFLETEIIYLEKRFKELIITPFSIKEPARHISNTIKLEHSLAQQNSVPKDGPRFIKIIRLGIRSLGSDILYKEIFIKPILVANTKSLIRAVLELNNALNVRNWLLSYIVRENLDLKNTIFYTYWFNPITTGLILAKSEFPDIKIISRAHRGDLYEESQIPPYIPFRQINLERINKVYAISDHGAKYILNNYRTSADKIVISRLGVCDPGFDTPHSKDGVIRIVSCSFLHKIKRVDLLMQGIHKLADLNPDLRIEWDHLGDGPLKRELEEQAENLFRDTLVKYNFHGFLPEGGIIEYYKNNKVDVFVNVSESEGIPVSIMEAQSCGIPVIATSVGGTPEIVNNENGILLNSNPSNMEIAYALETFKYISKNTLAKRRFSKHNWCLIYNAQQNYNEFCDHLLKL